MTQEKFNELQLLIEKMKIILDRPTPVHVGLDFNTLEENANESIILKNYIECCVLLDNVNIDK